MFDFFFTSNLVCSPVLSSLLLFSTFAAISNDFFKKMVKHIIYLLMMQYNEFKAIIKTIIWIFMHLQFYEINCGTLRIFMVRVVNFIQLNFIM